VGAGPLRCLVATDAGVGEAPRPPVCIRPWCAGDLALLERLLGDPAMTAYIGGPESSDAIRARHERYLGMGDAAGGVFAIEVGRDRAAAGWVGYWETEWRGEAVWEAGWSVLPELQGQGVATAATILILAHVREDRKHRYVHAFPSVDNAASNALCRTVGFAHLGEVDVEYPPGRIMRGNDWRFDLLNGPPPEQERRVETLEDRVLRVTSEPIAIVPYDPRWPARFRQERRHLLSCLPNELIVRIEHFGSTAVPGLAAKPIVDLLVEVTDLQAVKERIVPILESQGCEYFWRPTSGDDGPPWYAWFIRRDPATGARTHHIHMVEGGPAFEGHWDGLLFRDYLIEHPDVAGEYEALSVASPLSSRRIESATPRRRPTSSLP
jgi:GrpB-like predicted nucleotidyltransferase (UPF0157 family)/RimJ/RimL family protein N-acetyltransferase